jgi:thiol-disulfide isomerase/thioredoxin
VENFGDSRLAKKFGITRYPAIFVNDILVATPSDFGFYGKGEGTTGGRYAPLRSAESHARFRADLGNALRLVLGGHSDAAARAAGAVAPPPTIATLPDFTAQTIGGTELSSRDFAGRVLVVDFWATWCPPCRGTLTWLESVKKQYGNRVTVVIVAVDSPADAVRQLTVTHPQFVSVNATPAIARAFGDVTALPTLFVFGRDGRRAAVFYGAPPTLHDDVQRVLRTALAQKE